jgi:two-component sensor histidine kinase
MQTLLINSDELLEAAVADYRIKLNAQISQNSMTIQLFNKSTELKDSEIMTLEDSRDHYRRLYEMQCRLYNDSVQKGVDLQVQVDKIQNQLLNATSIHVAQTKRRRLWKMFFIGITAIVATMFGSKR